MVPRSETGAYQMRYLSIWGLSGAFVVGKSWGLALHMMSVLAEVRITCNPVQPQGKIPRFRTRSHGPLTVAFKHGLFPHSSSAL